MIPSPVPRQCLLHYVARLQGAKSCNGHKHCLQNKKPSESCGYWDQLTTQEKSDAGVLWRVSYSTDYINVEKAPGIWSDVKKL